MRALRRRRHVATYENALEIISTILGDDSPPPATQSQRTKKFVSCDIAGRRRSLPIIYDI